MKRFRYIGKRTKYDNCVIWNGMVLEMEEFDDKKLNRSDWIELSETYLGIRADSKDGKIKRR